VEVERRDDSGKGGAQGETVGDDGSLAYLDQALWKQLSAAPTPTAFAKAWLTLQCAMIADVNRGILLFSEHPGARPQPVARWPDDDVADLSELAEIADTAMSRGRGVMRNDGPVAFVGYPFIYDEQLSGIAAFEIVARSQAELRLVMRQLQWGGAWMEITRRRDAPDSTMVSQRRLVSVLEQVGNSLEHQSFKAAARAVATESATSLDCERVSIGFVKGQRMHPDAISHSADFGKRSNLVRAIGAAMDEALDQRETIVYPMLDGDAIYMTRAHAALTEENEGLSVCTVPFLVDGEIAGAWTFERGAERPFDSSTVQLFRHLASVVGPILDLKRQDERWLGRKALDSARRQLERLVGPKYFGRKITAAIVLALTLFFSFYTTTFRVGADAVLEGQIQRVVAAPMDGYIGEVLARAGDLVKEGDLLIALDDKDLRLEQVKWLTRKTQLERSRTDALGRLERAQSRIYKAQVDQADAELELLNKQLARTSVRAPFDGLIVSGDLSQSIGAPVERGDILMEVAPLEAYRVALAIDERDISYIEVGQTGDLILPSVTDKTYEFVVSKITPVATAQEGKNTFRIEADLLEPSEALRPGMEGTGKVEAGERRLIWFWTRRFTEWLQVWVWRWWY
jgi:RND family efflux transporter MFP subunit